MLFRYPALVEGIPHGFRKPRLCVVVREIDLPINALPSRDVPVAAVLTSRQSVFGQDTLIELPIRHVDGRFYIPDPTEPQALQGLLSAPFLDCPIRSDFLRLMNQNVPYSMERDGVWPQGVGLSLSLGMNRFSTEEDIAKLQEVVLTDLGMADAAVVDAMAEALYADIITIDGRLWRRVPEPTYVASLGNMPLQIRMTDVMGRVGGGTVGSVEYPLTAFDAAVDAMNAFGNRVSAASPRATVFAPEVFREYLNDVNYARFAQHLTTSPYEGPGSDLPRIQREIDKITTARVDEIDFDVLEDAVGQALAEAARIQAETGILPSFGMSRQVVDFHLDLWDSRIVEIAGVVPSRRMAP
jgi:hypothetical protein